MSDLLGFLLLGALMGLVGQGIRAIVGIKKEVAADGIRRNANPPVMINWFSPKELFGSLAVGALAGLLAAISQYDPPINLNKDLLFGLIAAGYSGADFITGLFKKA